MIDISLTDVLIVGAGPVGLTLAIDLAQRSGITLASFVRGGTLNVYTHPDRIAGLPTLGKTSN